MRRTLPRFAPAKDVGKLLDRVRNVVHQTHDRVRTHVLSRELCDESLRRIQTTLPAPGTCDVIDINPGICIWSEAVHDFLKPKRHVLVEANQSAFMEFLEPLLQKPKSAFRYARDLRTALSPNNGLLSPEVIESSMRTGQEGGRGPDQEAAMNKTLLVVANLSHATKAPGFTGSEAKRFLNNFYRSLFNTGDYIHRYGLVRLLAWIDENSTSSILPTSVAGQMKQSIQLDAAFDLRAIASPDQYKNAPAILRRWYSINELNLEDVRLSEAEMDLRTTPFRQVKIPTRPLQFYPPDTKFLADNRSWFPGSQKLINDLLEAETRIATKDPGWLHTYSRMHQRGDIRPGKAKETMFPNKSEDQRFYRRLINQLQTYCNNFHKMDDIIGQHRALWKQMRSLGKPQANAEIRKHKTLVAKYDELERITKQLKRENRIIVYKAVDDFRAYDATPRTLALNRRTFEPLQVQSDDFYPRQPLALIDLTPRVDFINRLNTIDKLICFDYSLMIFSMNRSDNVLQAVQRLVGARYEEFLASIPELKDVEKGGWHNPEDLRIRTLHWSFYVILAEAFETWPYRPSIEKLITPASSVFDKPI